MGAVILQIKALPFAEDDMFTHSSVFIAFPIKLKDSQVVEWIHTSVPQKCPHECNQELHIKSVHIIIVVFFASRYDLNSELGSDYHIGINSIDPCSLHSNIV